VISSDHKVFSDHESESGEGLLIGRKEEEGHEAIGVEGEFEADEELTI
jgi:hypothetical protein